MNRELINVGAPPIAPYSSGVKIGDLIFTAGQIGQNPKTGKLIPGDIKAEIRQALENVSAVLQAGGSSMGRVVKSTIFMVDMARDYAAMNEVYGEFFPEKPPARSTVQVSALALSARFEIEVVAVI